jgi:hypothetical protein
MTSVSYDASRCKTYTVTLPNRTLWTENINKQFHNQYLPIHKQVKDTVLNITFVVDSNKETNNIVRAYQGKLVII